MSSLLDEERREQEPTAVWELTGGDPPQSIPIMLPEGWDRPLALCPSLHMARQLVLGNMGAAAKDTADLKGTG